MQIDVECTFKGKLSASFYLETVFTTVIEKFSITIVMEKLIFHHYSDRKIFYHFFHHYSDRKIFYHFFLSL